MDYFEHLDFLSQIETLSEGMEKIAKVLTSKGREQIKSSNFALPGGRYPIHDKQHARSALGFVGMHGTPEEKAQVRAAVAARYPGLGKKASLNKLAKIFGEQEDEGIYEHEGIPYDKKLESFKAYARRKSQEAPTSWGKALGGGAAIGGLGGLAAGAISKGSLKGALLGGLIGTGAGAGLGALARMGDKREIDELRTIEREGLHDETMRRRMTSLRARRELGEARSKERRHYEMLEAIRDRR